MKRKSERAKQRAKEWRAENPDLVRKQAERKRLRAKGLLPPYVPTPKKSNEQILKEQAARMKDFHSRRRERIATDPEFAAAYRAKANASDKLRYERRKADPEAYTAWLAHKRHKKFINYRIKHGIPLDAPHRLKITEEERAARAEEQLRLKAERAAANPAKQRLSEDERKERLRATKRAYKKKSRDAERARRAAEVEAAKANQPPPAPPTVCPDPPELQALFRKASKGEPPTPHNPYVKKRSAFQIRGWI